MSGQPLPYLRLPWTRTHRLVDLATFGVVVSLTHSALLSKRDTGLVSKQHCGVLRLATAPGGRQVCRVLLGGPGSPGQDDMTPKLPTFCPALTPLLSPD